MKARSSKRFRSAGLLLVAAAVVAVAVAVAAGHPGVRQAGPNALGGVGGNDFYSSSTTAPLIRFVCRMSVYAFSALS